MKSAYELAMEKFGTPKEYTDEQKKQLAEIDQKYEAKVAEARLGAEQKLKDAGFDTDKQNEIHEELRRDLSRIEDKKEAEKNDVRGESES